MDEQSYQEWLDLVDSREEEDKRDDLERVVSDLTDNCFVGGW